MSKQHSTLSKARNFTIESFDIVAVCGNKVECSFDNVAGVDGALMRVTSVILSRLYRARVGCIHDGRWRIQGYARVAVEYYLARLGLKFH